MENFCLLVVDDAQVHRYLLQSGLDRISPTLRLNVAGSVGQAQQMLADNAYDAVLCDRMVPQARRLELLKWMRARPQYRSVPFIMVSSGSGSEDIGSASAEHGSVDGVVKPLHPETSRRKVEAAIEEPGRRRAMQS